MFVYLFIYLFILVLSFIDLFKENKYKMQKSCWQDIEEAEVTIMLTIFSSPKIPKKYIQESDFHSFHVVFQTPFSLSSVLVQNK